MAFQDFPVSDPLSRDLASVECPPPQFLMDESCGVHSRTGQQVPLVIDSEKSRTKSDGGHCLVRLSTRSETSIPWVLMGRRASKLYDACWHAEARHPLPFNLLAGVVLALFWGVLVGPWSAIPWLTLYPAVRVALWRPNGRFDREYRQRYDEHGNRRAAPPAVA